MAGKPAGLRVGRLFCGRADELQYHEGREELTTATKVAKGICWYFVSFAPVCTFVCFVVQRLKERCGTELATLAGNPTATRHQRAQPPYDSTYKMYYVN